MNVSIVPPDELNDFREYGYAGFVLGGFVVGVYRNGMIKLCEERHFDRWANSTEVIFTESPRNLNVETLAKFLVWLKTYKPFTSVHRNKGHGEFGQEIEGQNLWRIWKNQSKRSV